MYRTEDRERNQAEEVKGLRAAQCEVMLSFLMLHLPEIPPLARVCAHVSARKHSHSVAS